MSQLSIRPALLLKWMNALLVKQGMYAADAEIVSRRLIEAELLEQVSGGLRWLPRLLSAMDLGDIDPRAQIVTLLDLPALAVLDGSTGVGQVAITQALQLGVAKATAVGSATIVVKNSRPIGDPRVGLAAATAHGCIAGVFTTCKAQTDPWPVGPSSVWGWSTAESPLVTSGVNLSNDLPTIVLPTALAGTKSAAEKKKFFTDDAEYVCIVIDPAKCRPKAEFQVMAEHTAGKHIIGSPAWIFDSAQWPELVDISEIAVRELRDFAASARMPAEWIVR